MGVTGQEPDDRVWIPTTWAKVHAGANVRPPGVVEPIPTIATSTVTQQRLRPFPHTIVKATLSFPSGASQIYDFDPAAPVEMLVSPATARAVALLAGAGLDPQVLSEYETNESETPR